LPVLDCISWSLDGKSPYSDGIYYTLDGKQNFSSKIKGFYAYIAEILSKSLEGVFKVIRKERKKPIRLRKLEALNDRLSSEHEKRPKLAYEIAKVTAGYRGEQALDYYLRLLPPNKYEIIHDLRLSNNDSHFFQIDTLLLTPFIILILEIKNIAGTLYFDQPLHQMTRTINGKEEGFLDPILQVQKQKVQFKAWLDRHKLPEIPILPLVVNTNPSTILKSTNHHFLSNKVLHAAALENRLEEYEKKYKTEKYTPKDLKRLIRLCLKFHTPQEADILEIFRISESELIRGVKCPSCSNIPMKQKRGMWVCSKCHNSAKDAPILSLNDYCMLISPNISNKQARNFLLINSPSITTKLLSSLNVPFSGTYKNRVYDLSKLQEIEQVNREL
jgi:hypothetical protein